MKTRSISVEALGRIEGEAGLTVRTRDGVVSDVRLNVFEPPRFFEAFLRGRSYAEVPDIVARICGICPVAHQITACQAIEHAFGITIDPRVRVLRRLLYLGEWIESHALHIFLLHAPDFLGHPDAIALAAEQGELVARGLRIKKAGNAIVAAAGGREIHPINLRVGGVYFAPEPGGLRALVADLEWARQASVETTALVATLDFPEFEPGSDFVALQQPGEYAIDEGRVAGSTGISIEPRDYEHWFKEIHLAHANALHSVGPEGGPYVVGPLARFNLNREWLSPVAAEAARAAGLRDGCRNPFKSIVVRAVELVHACDQALAMIAQYERPEPAAVPVEPEANTGSAVTEAPRGLLFHRYRLDNKGRVSHANIVPPTAQNQTAMERDLLQLVSSRLALPNGELTALCEQAIRNYDPCISCATHFLHLQVEETQGPETTKETLSRCHASS